jgi:hypothetical protein
LHRPCCLNSFVLHPKHAASSGGRETKKTRLQKKLRLLHEVVIDLGLAHVRSRTFAIACLQIFLCAWMRVYLHSLAQWIYLYLLNRPVTDVAILPYAFASASYLPSTTYRVIRRYQVIISYSFSSSTLPIELGLCVVGRYGARSAIDYPTLSHAFSRAFSRAFAVQLLHCPRSPRPSVRPAPQCMPCSWS